MNTGKLIHSVFYGLGTIYAIAALFSLLFSLLLRFTSLQESEISYGITFISFVALFAGGLIAGRKGKEKGWLLGMFTGLSYTVINFSFQYLGFDSAFTVEQMIYYSLFILTTIVGGIIGVNSIGNRSQEG
ncbi:TIGR04086 family membrane protein [Fervidibacillus halotolerans]|uniref:TIGR04086 family membrane protein n=1 Tax=Fervidibacillus halotolerans TaxID=2980027 RepID=A0A9E8RWB2_9BACI|nr:TIGR04086 family membrane protein [Fervidibacillus halotolerans]WAA11565.1 TIGR04086 family membrane protein [Fervidibacillus halotolerans]